MSFLSRLFGTERKSRTLTTQELFAEILSGGAALSGVTVNWKTALEVSTVFRCAKLLVDAVATVPLKVYQKNGHNRTELSDHPVALRLGYKPNDWMTGLDMMAVVGLHLALCGQAFTFKNVVGGRLLELIPFEPGWVEVQRADDYTLSYRVTAPNGRQQTFPAAAIWHLRGMSWNSWTGLNPVHLMREAIGLSLATERAHARLHANGVRPSGLYSVDNALQPEQYRQLKAWIDENLPRGEESSKVMLLDRGAKFTPTTMTGVDAQHIETRRFQIEETARGMGVLPIMVGAGEKTQAYASSEQMFLAHVVHTVRPLHRLVEASIKRWLLTEDEVGAGIYVKFREGELLRGAALDRARFYQLGIMSGWLLRSDAREWEDLDWVDGLDVPLEPINMGGPTGDDNGGEGRKSFFLPFMPIN